MRELLGARIIRCGNYLGKIAELFFFIFLENLLVRACDLSGGRR